MTYDPESRIARPARRLAGIVGALALVGIALVVLVATWNLVGTAAGGLMGMASAPPPAAAGSPSPRPSAAASAPASSGDPSPAPSASSATPSVAPASSTPEPTPTPRPRRRPVEVVIESRPAAMFASEATDKWCAAAAVQIALNVNGRPGKADTSRAFQTQVRRLQVALTTRRDSRNGGAGPLGMVGSLEDLGKVDYELRDYRTRDEALRAAAKAISRTKHAAILLAWRGAHAWVMTGYRADADPTVFRNARVKGAFILDPWYPRVSSIWGPSDRPGVYQDRSEMRRNFLPWRRPEGRYPSRDGRFLVIVPVS